MNYALAQLNIARFKAAPEDPINADFTNNIDRVNQMAESAPGFIWRLQSDNDDMENTTIALNQDPKLIINLSVWQDIPALMDFTYKSPLHKDLMQRRKQWFEKIDTHLVLWWIDASHRPDINEAMAKLAYLQHHGSSKAAFTFANAFSPHGEPIRKASNRAKQPC